jgi:hypothetical protein
MIAGCGPSKEEQTLKNLAEKAKLRIADCKAIGDRPFRKGVNCVVWDADKGCLHPAHRLIGLLQYSSGEGPITVFLVSFKRDEQVGTYSITGRAGYRSWVDIFVIKFSNINDAGMALAAHELAADPPSSRIAQSGHTPHNFPSYGQVPEAIANWIISMPYQ